LVAEGATLDDILSLTVEDVLSRRLQTMVFKKGMAVSPLHARQLVSHGHVMVGKRRITVPGYGVGSQEEASVVLIGAKGTPAEGSAPETGQPAEAPAQ
jgi:small subunit ribosomal protein S4